MAGRPVRRGHAVTLSAARRAFDRRRAQILSLAVSLNDLRPGAGDVVLARADDALTRVIDEALSGLPRAEAPRK